MTGSLNLVVKEDPFPFSVSLHHRWQTLRLISGSIHGLKYNGRNCIALKVMILIEAVK